MNSVLIFAGGTGQRMKSRLNIPKQFLKVYNKPIIIYTIERFEKNENIDNIIVVCIKDWIKRLEKYLIKFNIKKVSAIIPGGESGFESRIIGLKYLYENSKNKKDIVLIHDGVRPIISNNTINDNIKMVKQKGCSITMGRATETISIIDENKNIKTTLDRNICGFARAPQSFYLNEIYDAYLKAKNDNREDLIDSASVFEYCGKILYTIYSSDDNIKITTPMDYYLFKALIKASKENKFDISVDL